jgi:hypothetical protein
MKPVRSGTITSSRVKRQQRVPSPGECSGKWALAILHLASAAANGHGRSSGNCSALKRSRMVLMMGLPTDTARSRGAGMRLRVWGRMAWVTWAGTRPAQWRSIEWFEALPYPLLAHHTKGIHSSCILDCSFQGCSSASVRVSLSPRFAFVSTHDKLL